MTDMKSGEKQNGAREGHGHFVTTHWSAVLTAGKPADPNAANALESLCQSYWLPLYLFVRRKGHGPDEAQDLTQ